MRVVGYIIGSQTTWNAARARSHVIRGVWSVICRRIVAGKTLFFVVAGGRCIYATWVAAVAEEELMNVQRDFDQRARGLAKRCDVRCGGSAINIATPGGTRSNYTTENN